MNEPSWHFPILDDGEEDSFNDPLQEHFQGNVEYYIARETIQNALDARANHFKPVRVEFEIVEIPAQDLPGSTKLKNYISACIDYDPGDKKARDFFNRSLEILAGKTVKVLRIGDYNTTGLVGGDTKSDGNNWFKLVKSVGKNDATGVAGGSFGIGKGAPFAASNLRYVLYSTRTNAGVAFQGKARLTSHSFNGEEYRGVGTWGVDGGRKAIRSEDGIDTRFLRDEVGTDVYICGYDFTPTWSETLLKSVLKNFWAAIHFSDLEVSFINGSHTIEVNSDNLLNLLENHQEPKAKDNPINFYQTVLTPSVPVFEKELGLIGGVRLYVRLGDGLPKAVQMMRLPKMVVKTLNPRVLSDEFCGVFMLEDTNTKGNELLKKLEPPKHDMWDPDRGKIYDINGPKIVDEIEDWIKECLKSLEQKDSSKIDEIPGLSSLLPEDDDISGDISSYLSEDDENSTDEKDIETATERTIIKEKDEKPRRALPIVLTPADVGGELPRQPESDGGGDGEGGGAGEDIGSTKRIDTKNLTVRIFPVGNAMSGKYRVIIHSPKNEAGDIKIIGAGDDQDYPLEIESARTDSGAILETNKSFVKGLSVHANRPYKFNIILREKRSFAYSVGVEKHGK